MSQDGDTSSVRSYGCTFGCGNPYDFIVVTVADGTVEMLCLPCYVRLAVDMISAVTNADDPQVKAAITWASQQGDQQVPGPKGKARGKNAPATTDDLEIFGAYQDVITPDELPEEFR